MKRVIVVIFCILGMSSVSFSELGGVNVRSATKSDPKANPNSDMEKAKRMLRNLKTSSSCSRLAKSHAKTLASEEFRVGVGKSHFNFPERKAKFNVRGRVAEINAATRGGHLESALRAWLNSPSHRKQLLSGRNEKYGLGRAKSKNGKYYWVMCIEQK